MNGPELFMESKALADQALLLDPDNPGVAQFLGAAQVYATLALVAATATGELLIRDSDAWREATS